MVLFFFIHSFNQIFIEHYNMPHIVVGTSMVVVNKMDIDFLTSQTYILVGERDNKQIDD